MNQEALLRTAGDYWSKVTDENSSNKKISWGNSPIISRHLSNKICGQPSASPIKALFKRCVDLYSKGHFEQGVSIGCGNASRELSLIHQGLVERFILFEISKSRIEQIKTQAERLGISDRVTIIDKIFEDHEMANEVDLIFWCHSLHHMFDVHKAVQWSYSALKKNGIFMMYEFVGAARFQWSDDALFHASKVKSILPKELLYDHVKKVYVDRIVKRPPRDKLILRDPTEAADSDRIIEAIKVNFNNYDLKYLGGIIYHLALNDIMVNFVDNPPAEVLLESFLIIDDMLSEKGMNNFATALAIKERI